MEVLLLCLMGYQSEQNITVQRETYKFPSQTAGGLFKIPSDHLLLDSAPNLEPLISSWEINKFENC
jgi:hypothetical protein